MEKKRDQEELNPFDWVGEKVEIDGEIKKVEKISGGFSSSNQQKVRFEDGSSMRGGEFLDAV